MPLGIGLTCAAWIACGPLALQEAAHVPTPAVRWTLGDGLRLSLGAFQARLRPRFHLDLVDPRFREIQEVTGGTFDERTDLRRSRLLGDYGFRKGTPLEDWTVRSQFNYADGALDWQDLVASYAGLPALSEDGRTLFRFGHFREPFGLEAMTSVSHLPFIERSAASNAFTPGRARGVQWSEQTDSSLVQIGAFRRADGDVFPDELGQETALTARALWQPGREPLGGFQLVQLGGTLSVRRPDTDGLRLSARPASRLFDRIVDTGSVDTDQALVYGLESLFQWDRSSLILEAFGADIEDVGGGSRGGKDAHLGGGHVGFFTFVHDGHAARWNPRRGGLRSASVPDLLGSEADHSGAVEAVLRLTWVDLQDGDVRGGRYGDLEVGLNYYLQPTTRFMLHWLGNRVESPDGAWRSGSAILARLQVQL